MKSRLFFVLPRFGYGGAEKVVADLAGRYAEDRQVYIVAVRDSNNPYPLHKGVQLIKLNGPLGLGAFFFKAKLRPEDTVFSTFADVNVLLCILVRIGVIRCKLILREALIPTFALADSKYPKLLMQGYKYFYRYASHYICLTDEMSCNLRCLTTIDSNNISVIPNIKPALRRLYWSPEPGDVHIISVGRLAYQKGFDQLILAFSEVRKKIKNIRLTIVGEGEDRSLLERLILDNGLTDSVSLVGVRNDPRDLVVKSHFYVLSSRYEGFSNALFEAMNCGVPALAVKENTGAELIVKQGVNGLLVDRCSVNQLRYGIEQMLNVASSFTLKANLAVVDEVVSKNDYYSEYDRLLAR